MSTIPSIKEISNKIKELEEVVSSGSVSRTQGDSILALVNNKKQQEQETKVKEIKSVILTEAKSKKLGKNLARIITVVVELVEIYADKLGKILEVAFKGDLKLSFAIELIIELMGDFAITYELLKDFVENTVEILYHRNVNTITGEETVSHDVKVKSEGEKTVKKKKSIFPSHCLGK